VLLSCAELRDQHHTTHSEHHRVLWRTQLVLVRDWATVHAKPTDSGQTEVPIVLRVHTDDQGPAPALCVSWVPVKSNMRKPARAYFFGAGAAPHAGMHMPHAGPNETQFVFVGQHVVSSAPAPAATASLLPASSTLVKFIPEHWP